MKLKEFGPGGGATHPEAPLRSANVIKDGQVTRSACQLWKNDSVMLTSQAGSLLSDKMSWRDITKSH